MSEIKIREARVEDLPRVVELLQQMSLDQPREAAGLPLSVAYYAAFETIRRRPSTAPARDRARQARRWYGLPHHRA